MLQPSESESPREQKRTNLPYPAQGGGKSADVRPIYPFSFPYLLRAIMTAWSPAHALFWLTGARLLFSERFLLLWEIHEQFSSHSNTHDCPCLAKLPAFRLPVSLSTLAAAAVRSAVHVGAPYTSSFGFRPPGTLLQKLHAGFRNVS